MTPMTQSKRAISLRFTREVRDLIENSVGEADLELEVKGHEYVSRMLTCTPHITLTGTD